MTLRDHVSVLLLIITISILLCTGLAIASTPTPASEPNPIVQAACCLSMTSIVAIILYLPYRAKIRDEAVSLDKVCKAKAEGDFSQLVGLMKNKSLKVSVEAATAIEQYGEAAIEPLLVHLSAQGPHKINAVRSATKPVSITLVPADKGSHVFVNLGPVMITPLVGCLALPKNDAYYAAITLLKEFGFASVDPLIKGLANPDPAVRTSAAAILGDLSDGRAIEPLIIALRDRDKDVRLGAVEALDKFDDPRTIGPLKELLKDPSLDVQTAATSALGDFSTELTGLPKVPDTPEEYYDETEAGVDEEPPAPVVREREIIREIVKVPCKYCGSLVDITKPACPACGAPFKL